MCFSHHHGGHDYEGHDDGNDQDEDAVSGDRMPIFKDGTCCWLWPFASPALHGVFCATSIQGRRLMGISRDTPDFLLGFSCFVGIMDGSCYHFIDW